MISNDEFENSIPESEDKAIKEVFLNGGCLLYSDMKDYKLKGKDALDKVVKKEVARWVLFLKSNYEYSWPSVSFLKKALAYTHFWFAWNILCQALGSLG